MSFLKIILPILIVSATATLAYFYFNETLLTSDESQTISAEVEQLVYDLNEDGVQLLTFEMPNDYGIKQELSTSLSFEADTYMVEADVPGLGLKKCIESSKGMSISIGMNDRSFDPRLLPPKEFVEDRSTFAEENDWLTSTETIDGQLFSRAEKTNANCGSSYTISYSGQVEGFITNLQFWFEGDYQENISVIEEILDSMDFKL